MRISFWMHPKPILLENGNHFTDFSASENGSGCIQNQSLHRWKQISQYIAHENGFGCIQNQCLDRCKQISQFIAHENGFGCVQNQSYWKTEIILQILARVKMVLDASKTNLYTDGNKLVNL